MAALEVLALDTATPQIRAPGASDTYKFPRATEFLAGTAAAPAIAATGDTNTGLYFPAADTVGLSTGGVQRVYLDSSGNLGIGTSSPSSARLTIATAGFGDSTAISANTPIYVKTSGGTNITARNGFVAHAYTNSSTAYADIQLAFVNANNTNAIQSSIVYTNDAALAFRTGGSNSSPSADSLLGTERMRLDSSGNLGIGTSLPAAKLDVVGDGKFTRSVAYGGSANTYIEIGGIDNGFVDNGKTSHWRQYVAGNATGQYLRFDGYLRGTGWTERMRLDSSGNLGLGTTPSAWGSQWKALQINTGASIYGSSAYTIIGQNIVGQAATDNYISNGFASRYLQFNGTHQWFTALSGTGGDPISFGDAKMTLDASGNLGVGTTPSAGSGLQIGKQFGGVNLSGGGGSYAQWGGSYGIWPWNNVGLGIGSAAAIGFSVGGTGTQVMTLDASGNLGIGTSLPVSRLDVREANRANSTNTSNLTVYTTTAQAADVGGTIALGGIFDGTTGTASFGSIRGGKENSTVNNYSGYLAFQTITNGGTLTERMRITSTGNIVAGASAALATNATNGFLYVPTCAGVPTGTPTAITGMAPIVVNTTNNKLYFYSGGAWRDAGP